jgi:hypothetical protein
MEITYWHLFAQLYQNEELSLPEIAKFMIIATSVGMIEDKRRKSGIGVNVLDNSQLHDALVLGLLDHQSPDKPISYNDMGQLLKKHPQTIGGSVNRLIAKGIVTKVDYGAAGAIYTVHQDMKPDDMPAWIARFTQALMQLHTNSDLRERTVIECKDIQYQQGLQVLKTELRDKFYRPRTPKKDKP